MSPALTAALAQLVSSASERPETVEESVSYIVWVAGTVCLILAVGVIVRAWRQK